MASLFGREYQLFIGEHPDLVGGTQPASTITPDGSQSTTGAAGEDFLTEPTDPVLVDKLRLKASIVDSKKGTSSNKDHSWIEIINLPSEQQKRIKVDQTVLLKAGYVKDIDDLALIYAGHVTDVATRKQGNDTITRVSCGTAAVVRRNVRVSRTAVREETTQDIAEYFANIAAQNGIPTGNIFIPIQITWPYGYTVVGSLFERLDEFCEQNNLVNYMSLGKLYIEPIDITQFIDTVQIVPRNVKGSIRTKNSGSGKTTKEEKIGIEFNTFLDGRISTAKKIAITYGDYEGDYRLMAVSFKMDSRGNDWDAVVSCERIT